MAKGGFRGGSYGGGGGVNMNMIKQAQKMQAEMMKMQAEMEEKTHTASAGGGMVSATVNGKYELVSIAIDPEAVDPEDIEMLEDYIVIAVNDVVKKIAETQESEMGAITGGLNIPGLF